MNVQHVQTGKRTGLWLADVTIWVPEAPTAAAARAKIDSALAGFDLHEINTIRGWDYDGD